MRTKIVAGNWKMNMEYKEANELVKNIANNISSIPENTKVLLAPPFVYLDTTLQILSQKEKLGVSAQDCYYEKNGAYTGEVSANMLSSMGCEYTIIGHSERRMIFEESNEIVYKKVRAALDAGLKVILCCGEPLNERKQSKHFEVVKNQLNAVLDNIQKEELNKIIIAYEPVWAIGTGETADPEQAQEMHHFIRKNLKMKFGDQEGKGMSILYGGSCKPKNARSLFNCQDIDGGLIGGASLKSEDFIQIVEAVR